MDASMEQDVVAKLDPSDEQVKLLVAKIMRAYSYVYGKKKAGGIKHYVYFPHTLRPALGKELARAFDQEKFWKAHWNPTNPTVVHYYGSNGVYATIYVTYQQLVQVYDDIRLVAFKKATEAWEKDQAERRWHRINAFLDAELLAMPTEPSV